MKTNIKQILEDLKAYHKNNPTTAEQNLDLSEIKPGQLHRTNDAEKNYDLFYFVVSKTDSNHSEVIPGTFDSFSAINTDIVLPKNVMGDFISLSLDLATIIPDRSIGKCFAIPDKETATRIIASLRQYQTGIAGEIPSYPFALPPIGKNDPSIAFHQRIKNVVESAKNATTEIIADFITSIKDFFTLNPEPVFGTPELALAAGTKQQLFAEFQIEEYDGSLSLGYDIEEKRLIINVFNADGEDSSALDGWKIFNIDGQELSTIQSAEAVIENLQTFDGMICLIDSDGNIHKLNKIS